MGGEAKQGVLAFLDTKETYCSISLDVVAKQLTFGLSGKMSGIVVRESVSDILLEQLVEFDRQLSYLINEVRVTNANCRKEKEENHARDDSQAGKVVDSIQTTHEGDA